MANFTNKTVKTITDEKMIVPFSTTIAGTISTQGASVVGVGTDFLKDLPMGSYLVDLSQNEFRRVSRVVNKEWAELEQAFSNDIALNTTPEVILQKKASPREISVRAIGDIVLTTNEDAAIPAGISVTDTRVNGYGLDKNYIVTPCIVDATGSSAIIEVLY